MRPQAQFCSRRGLLLVEAVLSAVIIGTVLVVISRGLAGQLRAVTTVEQYETLRLLAASQLAQLEADLTAKRLSGAHAGAFEPPHDQYRWELATSPRQDEAGSSPITELTLTVRRQDHPQTFTATILWPTAWLPREWL